ncbi:MAG: class I mannose-6-phosphate isomerase [Bacteroidales bacterium]|nr:class I mannose-6-phosphate isomerase [Bacteroidales bacterium]
MNLLYPLKFTPRILDKVWGGKRLNAVLNKNTTSAKAGESWEISGVEGHVSVVSEGFLAGNTLQELIEIYMGDLVGDHIYDKFGTLFPLLIKFIDANDRLSIQVHPDDELAAKRHGSFGKTELWYVVEADKNAEITVGFNHKVSKDEYLEHLKNKKIESILNIEKTRPGDVFFLPAGRVHAIGAGVLLAEIQQTSDITYRIYDYDRPDENGRLRDLHTDLALGAIDFNTYDSYKTGYKQELNNRSNLVACDYFTANIFEVNNPVDLDYFRFDTFAILICIDGGFELNFQGGSVKAMKGETVLVPATIKNLELKPLKHARFLEVYIP